MYLFVPHLNIQFISNSVETFHCLVFKVYVEIPFSVPSFFNSFADVIVTDIPFGEQHTVQGNLADFYLRCCQQFNRSVC